MIDKLVEHAILPTRDLRDACAIVWCDTERKECMYNECERCKDKKVESVTFKQ